MKKCSAYGVETKLDKQFSLKASFTQAWLGSLALSLVFVGGIRAEAADRTSFFVPRDGNSVAQPIPANAVFADQAFGDGASDGWKAYLRLWRAHHDDPSSEPIRQFLGLPVTGTTEAKIARGRSAPRWLQWSAGSYQQVTTPHFTVYSRAEDDFSREMANDLEVCYWIWTQMFFPMWEARAQVATNLAGLNQQDVSAYLKSQPGRITIRRKMRVVLFRDSAEYQQTLGGEIPGIEQSTGFYNDDKQTIFLYASNDDDVATRRHELVHQLFREATRSKLGRAKPGDDNGFWIVEGIAGYFESLRIGTSIATVGGWDAPRLQFARYRMLVHNDLMPIGELRADGRLAAQGRADIARWYAHAIAQTHHLLDSGDTKQRVAIYQLLNQRYATGAKIAGGAIDRGVEQRLRRFLSIDDKVIEANPISHPLSQLCLAGCEVTDETLGQIPPSPRLRWLDLSRQPISNDAIRRLAPSPESVEQLTLELTKVDPDLQNWLGQATSLRELDLSHTPMDDGVMQAISSAKFLEVLWMTGTKLTDQSIDTIAGLPKLQMVNLQQSAVTQTGLRSLKTHKPNLKVNE
ncbi:DUF1570 domain-containing protein [Planctomycetes bacterium K23_9]|uniref:Leucine Rich repeats (2 copies) n=1 Tax=Stieleria marina TaxID=1930275 RepID=A0A517NPJ7_9BACT|nr:Leucine Rich repeats (2 copies) [Planctomycetes bacterium K23_9]